MRNAGGQLLWLRAFGVTEIGRAGDDSPCALGMKSLAMIAYLADVALGPDGPEPTHFREDFRATGPSNYNHGKQAEQTHV